MPPDLNSRNPPAFVTDKLWIPRGYLSEISIISPAVFRWPYESQLHLIASGRNRRPSFWFQPFAMNLQ